MSTNGFGVKPEYFVGATGCTGALADALEPLLFVAIIERILVIL